MTGNTLNNVPNGYNDNQPKKLIINDCEISDATVSAYELSRYFSSTGTDLSQLVPYIDRDFKNIRGLRNVNYMTFIPITENEIPVSMIKRILLLMLKSL